jgi:acyl-CoA hydrolase
MQAKAVSDSSLVTAIQMMPHDANPSGNVHGGVIMKQVDTTAGVVALRHAGMNAVTASIDRLDFHYPAYVGDLLILSASINLVGKTSMEVGVRVECEDTRSGKVRHTASAYLTFVALGADGKPTELPPVILESDEQKRRNEEAIERRKTRLAEKKREAESRKRAK